MKSNIEQRWAIQSFAIFILTGIITVCHAWAEDSTVLEAVVIKVIDGDTVWVKTVQKNQRRLKVRLVGIDAPEICQPEGMTAQKALSSQISGGIIQLRTAGHDRYGRVLAQIWRDGRDVGAWMVASGLAWSYKAGQTNQELYGQQEADARASRQGVFAQEDPVAPSVFRKWHGACEHSPLRR